MLILTILALVTLGGWVLYSRDPYHDVVGMLLMIFGGAVLIVCLMNVPFNRLEVHARIIEIEALAATATAAREAGDGLEGAAFRSDIAVANQWIAAQKYWNGTMFDIWIPDAVDTLQPIR